MSIILGTGTYDSVKSGNAWQYFGNAYKKLAPKLETYLPYANKLKELENIKGR